MLFTGTVLSEGHIHTTTVVKSIEIKKIDLKCKNIFLNMHLIATYINNNVNGEKVSIVTS